MVQCHSKILHLKIIRDGYRKNMKKIFYFLLSLTVLLLTSCHDNEDNPLVIKVGAVAGPDVALIEAAKKEALKKFGLEVKIITFSDYNMPNQALEDGAIDVNIFQHRQFLQNQIQLHGYAFSAIGDTFVYPMGLYSDKITTISALSEKSKVGIPNDPSNETRALLLLQNAGLITLSEKQGSDITLKDIEKNPKKLLIIEADAAQLPRLLDDVAIAAINANYAVAASIPIAKALFSENKNSPYMNVIVTKTVNQHEKKIQEFVEAYQSQAVIDEAKKIFGDGAIPGFEPKK